MFCFGSIRLVSALFVAMVWCNAMCPAQILQVPIIPRPQNISLEEHSQGFVITKRTKIVAKSPVERNAASILNESLQSFYGFKLVIATNLKTKNAIFIGLSDPKTSTSEGYSIRALPWQVLVNGSERGLFYGVQSLLQMIKQLKIGRLRIPKVDIDDAPRFPYRGMHLDVSRHFMPVEFVKKYIDLMAQYKFNYFHWHLTDDQGWRIEIKEYPKLTEIGSTRPESQLGAYTKTFRGDGVPVSGFYTQDQIKEVVAYAKARYITVIPEIEMPGHSSAALAAVLGEVIDLFPDSPYIHIGGDEVLKDMWKDSPDITALMEREHLKDTNEVQSYFVQRMERFINSKGKRIIGWDEILEGGLAPNAVVMSWRGNKGGIEAARAHHDVIMTPTDYSYFDYPQGDPRTEPIGGGGHLTLEKVYSFDPVPKELTADEAKYILGGQGNVWTEYMQTPEQVEYMVFPRMLAMAEDLWSTPENKDYADFRKRLDIQLARLAKQGVKYRRPDPLP
jgi:hexosaminidase